MRRDARLVATESSNYITMVILCTVSYTLNLVPFPPSNLSLRASRHSNIMKSEWEPTVIVSIYEIFTIWLDYETTYMKFGKIKTHSLSHNINYCRQSSLFQQSHPWARRVLLPFSINTMYLETQSSRAIRRAARMFCRYRPSNLPESTESMSQWRSHTALITIFRCSPSEEAL